MGRPPRDLDDHLDWQERRESFESSGLEVSVFCAQEGISRSTFYRWANQLKNCIPEQLKAEKEAREQAESAQGAAFVPVTLKSSPVEIELPNGGIIRLPLGVGQAVLVDTIRAVTAANENIFVAASAELRKLVVGLCERGVKDIDR